MGSLALHMLDNKIVKTNIKKQLKNIRKCKMDTAGMIEELTSKLRETYVVTRADVMELCVKPDKKKKVEDVEIEIRGMILGLINNIDIDIDTIFNIKSHENEIFVRVKRYNGC